MGGIYDYDGEFIPGYILEKDETDVILESLKRTGHEKLAKSIKEYIEFHCGGPYEDYPPEMPMICFAPL